MIKIKVLNFTAVEILPALLDKSKTQTIRKAWKDEEHIGYDMIGGEVIDKWELLKPPRFKVGDKVQIMWNQRNKCDRFDCEDGIGIISLYVFKLANPTKPVFNKLLGTGEITEVFEIEIHKYQVADNNEPLKDKYAINCKSLITEDLFDGKILAKRDGFKSAEDMFSWFDKKYNLSAPKKFYVYRWRWLK